MSAFSMPNCSELPVRQSSDLEMIMLSVKR